MVGLEGTSVGHLVQPTCWSRGGCYLEWGCLLFGKAFAIWCLLFGKAIWNEGDIRNGQRSRQAYKI